MKLCEHRGDFLQMWLPFQWCEIGISGCEITRSHVIQLWTEEILLYLWKSFWQTTYAEIKVHNMPCFRTNTTLNKNSAALTFKTTVCKSMTQHTILYLHNEIELLPHFFVIWHWMRCSDWSDTRNFWLAVSVSDDREQDETEIHNVSKYIPFHQQSELTGGYTGQSARWNPWQESQGIQPNPFYYQPLSAIVCVCGWVHEESTLSLCEILTKGYLWKGDNNIRTHSHKQVHTLTQIRTRSHSHWK